MTRHPMPSAPPPATRSNRDRDPGLGEREHATSLIVDHRISPRFGRIIEAACQRPDLARLGSGAAVTLDLDLGTAFRVERNGEIVLGSAALTSPALTALSLRHALELALLAEMTPPAAAVARLLASGLLALRSTGFYLQVLPGEEGRSCRSLLPRWQREAVDLLTVARPQAVPKDMLASIAGPLLQLQGRDFSPAAPGTKDPTDWSLVSDILGRAADLAIPVEALVNGEAKALGVSTEGYRAAERLRRDLLSAALLGDLEAACAGEWQRRTGHAKTAVTPNDLILLAVRDAKH